MCAVRIQRAQHALVRQSIYLSLIRHLVDKLLHKHLKHHLVDRLLHKHRVVPVTIVLVILVRAKRVPAVPVLVTLRAAPADLMLQSCRKMAPLLMMLLQEMLHVIQAWKRPAAL